MPPPAGRLTPLHIVSTTRHTHEGVRLLLRRLTLLRLLTPNMASEAGGMEIDDGMELISESAAGPSSVIAIPPPPLVQQQQQQTTTLNNWGDEGGS